MFNVGDLVRPIHDDETSLHNLYAKSFYEVVEVIPDSDQYADYTSIGIRGTLMSEPDFVVYWYAKQFELVTPARVYTIEECL